MYIRNPFTGLLFEEATSTVDTKTVQKTLTKKYSTLYKQAIFDTIMGKKADVTIRFMIKPLNLKQSTLLKTDYKAVLSQVDAVDTILTVMNDYGYIPSQLGLGDKYQDPKRFVKYSNNNIRTAVNKYAYIQILFRPKFNDEVKITEPVLYHITPSRLLPDIKSKGLVPTAGSKLITLPPRVYLTKSLYIIKSLLRHKTFKKEEYSLLKIDTSKLPKDIVYHDDHDASDSRSYKNASIYTYSTIPPKAIKVIDLKILDAED
jgi:hypothetical protein